jgi:hypothetical protein
MHAAVTKVDAPSRGPGQSPWVKGRASFAGIRVGVPKLPHSEPSREQLCSAARLYRTAGGTARAVSVAIDLSTIAAAVAGVRPFACFVATGLKLSVLNDGIP